MANTDIVKGMYAAFGRGDVAGVLNGLADDIDWLTPGSKAIPYAGRYNGKSAVTGFFQKLAETCELDPFVIEQYVEQGDVVVALGSYSGRVKSTKKPFQSRWSMMFKFRGGTVAKFEEYLDTEALGNAFSSSQAARG
jgi:ketosteroid isomerase-like protein